MTNMRCPTLFFRYQCDTCPTRCALARQVLPNGYRRSQVDAGGRPLLNPRRVRVTPKIHSSAKGAKTIVQHSPPNAR